MPKVELTPAQAWDLRDALIAETQARARSSEIVRVALDAAGVPATGMERIEIEGENVVVIVPEPPKYEVEADADE